MRFWDSSAILPLVAVEPESAVLKRAYGEDREVATWWATPLECTSALERRRREGVLSAETYQAARSRLRDWHQEWIEMQPSDEIREVAERLLRTHPLRAADALQLAAAITAANMRPTSLEFVTLDQRLADAARREGFGVVPGGA